MEEWLSYRPADFLMFSDRTYWRLFALENAALAPLPVVAPLAAALAGLLAWRRPAVGVPALAVLLAVGWAVAGGSFVWQRFAPVNWAMGYMVPLFLAQALLLLVLAGHAYRAPRGGDSPAHSTRSTRSAGFALLGYAVLLHPFVGLPAGRPLAGAEIVGIAPDPTAIATLGFALLLPAGWRRWVVLVVPAAWLVVSAMTLWLLDTAQLAVPVAALLVTVGALVADRLARSSRAPAAPR